VDNCNKMCVIVMYKFSGCHIKILCCFFILNDLFLQKSTDLLVNSADLLVSSTDFEFP
jgi:hypothetical protein